MKKTITELILDYLKKHKSWHTGGELSRILGTLHYPQTVSRALRHLAEDKIILRDERPNQFTRPVVIYKTK